MDLADDCLDADLEDVAEFDTDSATAEPLPDLSGDALDAGLLSLSSDFAEDTLDAAAPVSTALADNARSAGTLMVFAVVATDVSVDFCGDAMDSSFPSDFADDALDMLGELLAEFILDSSLSS